MKCVNKYTETNLKAGASKDQIDEIFKSPRWPYEPFMLIAKDLHHTHASDKKAGDYHQLKEIKKMCDSKTYLSPIKASSK